MSSQAFISPVTVSVYDQNRRHAKTTPFLSNRFPSRYAGSIDRRREHLHVRKSHKMCVPFTKVNTNALPILTYPTKPINGQKTGTSGMRKKTSVLLTNPKFLPNWIQSLFNALAAEKTLKGTTFVLGGDGRFYNKVAAQTIIRMAAANGVSRLVVGRDALMTTPAASALIPHRKAFGGIILTASHNPAGPHADWGIKYNTASGAPAQDDLTAKIYEETKSVSEYHLADLGGDVDLSVVGEISFSDGAFTVEVIDPVEHYIHMLSSIFDFEAMRKLLARPDFSFVFDAMHASTGEYANILFETVLNAPNGTVVNSAPSENFGGGHPDPNLTYAADLVARLDPLKNPDAPDFGAASDGDGDRNMILGKGVFVSPGDSVAIIADYAQRAIPYFSQRGVSGVARSIPTSSALDRVAEELGVDVYATPTGWKYFTSLMDAGKINVCGEESFGTGSDHIREKDGLWTVLAWLSILAYENQDTPVGKFVSVEDILLAHWRKYGRTYNMRFDYEEVEDDLAELMMINLHGMAENIVPVMPENVESVRMLEYIDPVDKSFISNLGFVMRTFDGGRVIYRLSGTGSAGATIRIYFEKHEPPSEDIIYKDAREEFRDLEKVALELARVEEFSARSEPSVIT